MTRRILATCTRCFRHAALTHRGGWLCQSCLDDDNPTPNGDAHAQ